MADVTGPISSLPGSGHSVPDGAMCDEHPDRPAVARVQGETDSFGCEMIGQPSASVPPSTGGAQRVERGFLGSKALARLDQVR